MDLRTGEIRTAVVFANRADVQEQYDLKVRSRFTVPSFADAAVPNGNSFSAHKNHSSR